MKMKFLLLALLALGFAGEFLYGSEDEHDSMVATVFSRTLFSPEDETVLIVKRINLDDLMGLVEDKDVDFLKFVQGFSESDSILAFEVTDSFDDSMKGKIIFLAEGLRRGPLFPETGTPSFFPENATSWVLALSLSEIKDKYGNNSGLYKGSIIDKFYGLLPEGRSRVMDDVIGSEYFEFLKATKALIERGDLFGDLGVPGESGLARQTLLSVRDEVDLRD